jgi:hypothetical protein
VGVLAHEEGVMLARMRSRLSYANVIAAGVNAKALSTYLVRAVS